MLELDGKMKRIFRFLLLVLEGFFSFQRAMSGFPAKLRKTWKARAKIVPNSEKSHEVSLRTA